jgi:hypothetical protein
MLSFVMLSFVMLSFVMLSVIMLSFITLSVIMLSIVNLSVVMLNVAAPFEERVIDNRLIIKYSIVLIDFMPIQIYLILHQK